MKITTVGRQMDVSEDLKALFEKKLRKFDKFFRDDAKAYITLSKKRNLEVLELTISSGGTLYRSEKASTTFNNALDEVIEAIERQIRKNKTRLEKRLRDGAFVKENGDAALASVEEEPEFNIRVKSFAIKPMTPEEAILQMNLIGHSFFMFRNAESDEVNVVYKRYDNGYGLIIPT
ncbi:MAG: ribosome-associated translation inhibitor RaiA [Eubacteriales bacterium]|nr:ribosome-associated translation inhibitor RaiA [Eubacteriales bacterium]